MEPLNKPTHLDRMTTKVKTLVILGKQGVGKTTIFRQFHGYYESRHPDTNTDTNRLVYRNDRVHMTVSDINLPATLDDVCLHTIPKGDAYVLVFDLADTQSFDYVEKIKDYLLESRGPRYPITFVGNKRDVPKRALRYELIDCLVSIEWEMKYLEISATKEDAVPELLEAAFPKKKLPKFASAVGDFDIFEFRGEKFFPFFPRATTQPNLYGKTSSVRKDRIVSLVDQGVLPEGINHGGFRKRFSMPILSLLRTKSKAMHESIEVAKNVKSPKGPNIMSQLFTCLKCNGSMHGQ